MAEVPRPKYDSLPGIDTSPDVYETPDLDDDTSTIQASTAVSESDHDSSQDESSAVTHSRLQPDQARNRFRPSRVDARGVDFSDNIAAQRRSYRTSTRSQRRRGEILGDADSDEEREKETFERKLERVRQEVLSLDDEYTALVARGDKKALEKDPKEVMQRVSDMVDTIYAKRRGGVKGAQPALNATIEKFNAYKAFAPSEKIAKAIENAPPLPGTQVQRSQLNFVLQQAADFDARLGGLEKALGLDGNTMPDIGVKPQFPVFSTLEIMERKISTVAEASAGKLENASLQVQKLVAEAEHLKELRAEDSTHATSGLDSARMTISAEQEEKINALYSALPAIDKLSPGLPMVLDVLRSMRFLHTTAFEADSLLKHLELRQAKQEDEIQKWEKALVDSEKNVVMADETLQQHMKVLEGWVKGVEEKVDKLANESG